MKRILSGLDYLDNVVLRGGIPSSSVTEITGDQGSWRSSLCKAFWEENPGATYFNQDEPPYPGQASLRHTSTWVRGWKDFNPPAPLVIIDGVDAFLSYEESAWPEMTYPADKRQYDVLELYKSLRDFAVAKSCAVLITTNLYSNDFGTPWTEAKATAREHLSTTIYSTIRGRIRNSSGLRIGDHVGINMTSTIIPRNKSFVAEPERGNYGSGLDKEWSTLMYLIHGNCAINVKGGGYLYSKEEKLLGRINNYRDIVRDFDTQQ